MTAELNLIGQKFGRWTVVSRAPKGRQKGSVWNVVCDCGTEAVRRASKLKSGHTQGCKACAPEYFTPANKTHGATDTRLYGIWEKMKDRCGNPNSDHFRSYGGRGISVCAEWSSNFVAFQKWALSHGYVDDLTIERNDVNGDYEPSNCCWITMREQARNRQNTKRYEYKGQLLMADEISTLCGLPAEIIRNRLKLGWSMDEATTITVSTIWHRTSRIRKVKPYKNPTLFEALARDAG